MAIGNRQLIGVEQLAVVEVGRDDPIVTDAHVGEGAELRAVVIDEGDRELAGELGDSVGSFGWVGRR